MLTGPLEETNRAYAIAKIAAIELCDFYRQQYGCDFISAMLTNLYGSGGNFDWQSSELTFDKTKPDGTPRKLLDVSRINDAGWQAKISLSDGIKSTFAWYQEEMGNRM